MQQAEELAKWERQQVNELIRLCLYIDQADIERYRHQPTISDDNQDF